MHPWPSWQLCWSWLDVLQCMGIIWMQANLGWLHLGQLKFSLRGLSFRLAKLLHIGATLEQKHARLWHIINFISFSWDGPRQVPRPAIFQGVREELQRHTAEGWTQRWVENKGHLCIQSTIDFLQLDLKNVQAEPNWTEFLNVLSTDLFW